MVVSLQKELNRSAYKCLNASYITIPEKSCHLSVEKEVSIQDYEKRLYERVTSVLMLNPENPETAVQMCVVLSCEVLCPRIIILKHNSENAS